MPYATLDGLRIHYEVAGSGPPLLMLAPGGFDAAIERWRMNGVWAELRPLETLQKEFQIIAYDRREIGLSDARVEPLSWEMYAREAVGLLDHLKIDRAYALGGCIGCALALALGARFPERFHAFLMHWPVGGYRWMHKGLDAFNGHIEFVRQQGLAAAAERGKQEKTFWRGDPSAGPWAWTLSRDAAFAAGFVRQDPEAYLRVVERSRDNLFNDTMPSGASGEQIVNIKVPAFIMSGDDPAHSHSSAVTLRELLPDVVLSPHLPPQQNAETVGRWIRDSVAAAGKKGAHRQATAA